MKYTKNDIITLLKEENVEFIRLEFTDIFGRARSMTVMPEESLKRLWTMEYPSMVPPFQVLVETIFTPIFSLVLIWIPFHTFLGVPTRGRP